MIIVFIRAVIVYCVVIFAVRLMGKRQIGELQPSELVVTILISNIATLPVEDTGIPISLGIIPILTVAGLDVLISRLCLKHRGLRKVLSGRPVTVINDGKIDTDKLTELRFTADDLMESLRTCDVYDISEVQYAIVETTGKLSVYQKSPYRTLTREDIGSSDSKEKNPQLLIVDSGRCITEAMDRASLSIKWLENVLKHEKIRLRDVFIMTAGDGEYRIVCNDGSVIK